MKQICDRKTRKQLHDTVMTICSKKITVIIFQMLLPHLNRQENGNIFATYFGKKKKTNKKKKKKKKCPISLYVRNLSSEIK